MINVITELSKYVILTLMIVYTFHCFYMVWRQDEEEKKELLQQQLTMIFFIDFTAFLVIYLKSMDFKVILFYIEMMIFFAAIQILYRIIYKEASLLLLNNMCIANIIRFWQHLGRGLQDRGRSWCKRKVHRLFIRHFQGSHD